MSALPREAGHILTPAFLHDPYPAYAALRDAGPLHWSDEFCGGAWLLTRHGDVEAALRDPRLSAQRTGGWVMNVDAGSAAGAAGDTAAFAPGPLPPGTRAELRGFQQLFARALLFVDAPEHPRLRRVLQAGFRADALKRLAPQIDTLVTEMLDRADAGGARFDFMQAVARPLPARVIALMMGVEDAAQADYVAWSDDLADFIGAAHPTLAQVRRAQTALQAMTAHFEALLPQRRRHPGDDLVSRLLQAEAAGDVQPGPELLAQCAMLLFAGHETTRNLLGNGLRALLAHPAQWQRLVREPALLPDAVRELLRYDSPVQHTGRRVATAMVLHGQALCRGDAVIALIGSANRDPARFAQPDRLDITRAQPGLLAFGTGPHVCLGAALSLMEAEAVFRQMLRRWPALQMEASDLRWVGNPVYRGLERLPVRSLPR